jgi:hypothetical protein
MTSKTVRRDHDIDFEAIARWNNEGGAPGPLKRGANCFRLYNAVEFEVHSNCGHNGIPLIPMRGVDLNQHCATLVQKDTAFHWPLTNTEADKRVWRYRKQQLGNRVADTPASTSHDNSEKELVTQAAQDPRRENLASNVSYDLWRFSCEMPDAPHLRNNLTPP